MSKVQKIEDRLSQDNVYGERLTHVERVCFANSQYSRRECLEFVGLAEDIEGKALEDKVIETCKVVGVKLNSRDFHAIHRLQGQRKAVVIAKLCNRRDSRAILQAKKKLRNLSANESGQLGVPVDKKVYINESLCGEYRKFQGIANKLYKKKLIGGFYTMNGTVRVNLKANDIIAQKYDDVTVSITHIQDFYKLFGHQMVDTIFDD